MTRSATDEVLEYYGLVGTSSLIQGYGLLAVVDLDGTVGIRIGLQTSLTVSGILLGLLSLLASIPLLGIPLVLYLLLHDHVASRVTHELDILVGEIYTRLDRRPRNG